MPKVGAAKPPPQTQTVETTQDADKTTVENKTTGAKATVRHPKATPAKQAPAKPKPAGEQRTLADEDDHVSVLYYGPYGSGKTVDSLSMARLPESGQVLLINIEAGAKKQALRYHDIDPARIVPWPERGEEVTYAGLEKLFYKIAGDLEADPTSWLGGVWDSCTALEAAMITEVVGGDIEKQMEILQAAGGKTRSGNVTLRDAFLYETDDYIRTQNKVRDLLRKYRYLPWHFAMTALVRRDEDKRSGRVAYGPAVSPKLQNELGGTPDIVMRTFTADTPDGPVWFGRTFGTEDEPAKDRLHMLPRELVSPTFDRIMQYVHGELTADQDPEQQRLPKSGKITRQAVKQEEAKAKQTGATETRPAPKRTPTRTPAAKKPPPKPSELGSNDEPPF